MLSTSSYSKAIVQDNFKRNWSIPVMGFIAYAMFGLMPVLTSYRSFKNIADYAEGVMRGSSFMVNAVIIVIAIVTASVVFGYLHNQTSSNAMHAMPTNRSKLFASAVISGWVLMIIPLVVFGFSMLILRGATTVAGMPQDESIAEVMFGGTADAKEIYTLPHVLGFILTGVINASYAFAVSCLAAVLAGKKVIHELLAFFLLVLPALIASTIESMMSEYLFGFTDLNIDYSWLGATFAAMSKEGYGIQIVHSVYYLALTVAILAASLWIYKKVKLERIGNSTTFPEVADVLVVLLTVLLSITFGNTFTYLVSTTQLGKPMMCAIATLASSILYYVIMRMVADGGPSIFNKKNMLKYLPCLGILIVLLAFTAYDITGFNTRMPAAEEVESVHVYTTFPAGTFNTEEDFSDPAAIESLLGLQKAIIDDRDVSAKEGYNSDDFTLTWKLKDGREIKRKYDARKAKEYARTEKALKELYNTASFKEKLYIDAEKVAAKCSKVTFFIEEASGYYSEGSEKNIAKEDWKGFFEAINKDFAVLSYEDMEAHAGYAMEEDHIVIDMTYKEKDEYDNIVGDTYCMTFKDKNTVDFLKSKGYMK